MKKVISLLVSLLVFCVAFSQVVNSDYYQKLGDYTIDIIPTDIGGNILLGRGIDISNPETPRLSSKYAFNIPTQSQLTTQQINGDVINQASTSYLESQSDYEKARSLYFNFKAAYMFASLSTAYSQTLNEKNSFHSIQFIMENTTTAPSINVQQLQWINTPSSEPIANLEERRLQFIEEYGTHYIQSINYGFRIAIEGKIQSSDASQQSSFSAAFKAWSYAKGNIQVSSSDILKQSSVQLVCVITAGSITPSTSIILRGFDDITEFLKKLIDGNVKVTNAPISCNIKSYRSTLTNYPKSKEIFKTNTNLSTAPSPYGVPKGTIIAWYPDRSAIKTDNGVQKIIPPKGWNVCDGSNNTPDLKELFLIGATTDYGTTGGSKYHSHNIEPGMTKLWPQVVNNEGIPLSNYNTRTKDEPLLPPFFKVIYLIRTSD